MNRAPRTGCSSPRTRAPTPAKCSASTRTGPRGCPRPGDAALRRRFGETSDGALALANPEDDQVYLGCYPGLTVIACMAAAQDHPSTLDQRFLDVAKGKTLYLHAMRSVVDWFAYAVWDSNGELRRSLSLWPDEGIVENIGEPLPIEQPYRAGERAVGGGEDGEAEEYPLPFQSLEGAEEALLALFGFNHEGVYPGRRPGH